MAASDYPTDSVHNWVLFADNGSDPKPVPAAAMRVFCDGSVMDMHSGKAYRSPTSGSDLPAHVLSGMPAGFYKPKPRPRGYNHYSYFTHRPECITIQSPSSEDKKKVFECTGGKAWQVFKDGKAYEVPGWNELPKDHELRGAMPGYYALDPYTIESDKEKEKAKDDYEKVEHPKHYCSHPSGVECIQVTEWMNFNLGNAVKYLWRASLKGKQIQDLKKAIWYIEREIQRLNGNK